jgi:hypothetical protein
MQQRIIWQTVLIIGTLISVTSCKKTIDKAQYEEFTLINNSGYQITIKAYTKLANGISEKTFNIAVNEFLMQEIELMAGSRTGIIPLSDSVVVIFDNERAAHYIPATVSPFNILNLNNFIKVRKGENRNAYTYTFTNDDYVNAIEM